MVGFFADAFDASCRAANEEVGTVDCRHRAGFIFGAAEEAELGIEIGELGGNPSFTRASVASEYHVQIWFFHRISTVCFPIEFRKSNKANESIFDTIKTYD